MMMDSVSRRCFGIPPTVGFDRALALVFTVLVALAIPAAAQNITGLVLNGTTGKPSAGDTVTLIKISQAAGMEEAGSTKTDAQGKFSFSNVSQDGPHLVRVEHAGVNYHKMVPPGTTTAEVQVYEAVKDKLDGISTAVEMAMQARAGVLQVVQIYGINNASNPPRTLAGDHTWQVSIPEDAQIDDVSTQAPNGQPVATTPTPVPGKKGVYGLGYPLRPGTTQIRLGYHMPYSGSARIEPGLLGPVQHLLVVYPAQMQFAPANARTFTSTPSGDNRLLSQIATKVTPGAQMAFTVSGTGTFPQDAGSQGGDQSADSGGGMPGGSTSDARPGGGLGAPIGAPDPLTNYRWPILGSLGLVLAAGAAFVSSRRNQPRVAPAGAASMVPVNSASDPAQAIAVRKGKGKRGAGAASQSTPNTDSSNSGRGPALLEAMKEELFQLEIDFTQGRLTEAEYQQAKVGVDAALKRALSRMAANQ